MNVQQDSNSPGTQARTAPAEIITLDPLVLEGIDALTPADDEPIAKITLSSFDLASRGYVHRIITAAGEHLLAALSPTGKHFPPFPSGLLLIRATLLVFIKGVSAPCTVEVSPATGILISCPHHAPLIRHYFQNHHFLRTVPAALLFLACLAFDDPQISTPSSQPEPNDCPVYDQDTVPSGDTPPLPPPDENTPNGSPIHVIAA